MNARKKPSDVWTIGATESVLAAARELDRRGVGCLVVVDGKGRAKGLVTDRDLALRVVAAGRDPKRTKVSAVMSTPLVAARAGDSSEAILARMEAHGVRRVPVLERDRVTKIVTLDEILIELGEEISDLGFSVRR